MKRIKTLALALACIMVLMLSLTSCGPIKDLFFDEEGNFIGLDKFFRDGEEDEYVENIELWNGSAYELEYESNGDGTCTVFIRTNAGGSFSSFGSGVVVYDEAYERVSSEKIYFSADKIDGAILIPSEDITANYYTVPTSYSVEIPEISPDGDRVTAVGDSEFLAYANVPRILGFRAFERILEKLESNNEISQYELDKFKAFYFEKNPHQVDTEEAYQMSIDYPVTSVIPVYVLDDQTTVAQLEALSEILEEYANYTASDYRSDFGELYERVAEEDSVAAESLKYGNFADNIERVILPSTIVKIEDNAFANCYNMERIDLPANLQSIGAHAFEGCAELEQINIPNATTYIGVGAFAYCESLNFVEFACTDGWVRTDRYGNAENVTFSDAETNISYLKAEGFEYTRISR